MKKRRLTKEQYKQAYNLLYTKMSKATAEVKNGNETVKSVYRGPLSELFGNVELCSNTITAFLWAVSHKTNALPTILFKISRLSKGVEISRVHSGFYNDKGEHIVGVALVPFIMDAMREYKPSRTYTRKEAVPVKEEFDISNLSDEELYAIMEKCDKELQYRKEIRDKQTRIQSVLTTMGITKEELLDLLGVC